MVLCDKDRPRCVTKQEQKEKGIRPKHMTLPEACCFAQVSEKFGSAVRPIQIPIGDSAFFDSLGRITNITKPK